jgi:hypothetical protein
VVAALVQEGGWGSTSAAPIVRDVVKMYYDKKSGHLPPPPSTADNLPPAAVHPVGMTAGAQQQ